MHRVWHGRGSSGGVWRPRPGRGRVGAPVPHGTAGKPSSVGCPGAVTLCLAGRSRSGLGRRSVCHVPGASMRTLAGRGSAGSAARPSPPIRVARQHRHMRRSRAPCVRRWSSRRPRRSSCRRGIATLRRRRSSRRRRRDSAGHFSSPTDVQPVFDAIVAAPCGCARRASVASCDSTARCSTSSLTTTCPPTRSSGCSVSIRCVRAVPRRSDGLF